MVQDTEETNQADEFSRNLRDYQQEIITLAESRNLIVYLPTGSGKTFIAIEILRSRSAEIRKKLSEGGKRSVFLVHTKALVEQQGNVLSTCTNLQIGKYTGDMNVDHWSAARWTKEIETNNVLVMVGDIFKDILSKQIISLQTVNLIIFDECHHGVGDSSYRCIMKEFEHVDSSQHPAVLGLSATVFNANVDANKVGGRIRELEITYHATVATVDDMSKVIQFSANPHLIYLPFAEVDKTDLILSVNSYIKNLIKLIKEMDIPKDGIDEPDVRPSSSAILERKNSTRKWIINSLEDVVYQMLLCGVYGGRVAVLHYLIQFQEKVLLSDNNVEQTIYEVLVSACSETLNMFNEELDKMLLYQQIYRLSSPQVVELLHLLKQHHSYSRTKGEVFKCIIFVQRRVTAYVLYHVLKNVSNCDGLLNFVKHDFMTGGQGNPFLNTRQCVMERQRNEETLKKFSENDTNILIATNVADEGVDISLCNLVVKFDPPQDFRNYIQSKGRARLKGSRYVIMSVNEKLKDLQRKIDSYHRTESALKSYLISRSLPENITPNEAELQQLYATLIPTYFVDGPDGPHITAHSAIPLLERYCGKLPQDLFSCLSPIWWYEKSEDCTICYVQLPTVSPLSDIVSSNPMPNKQMAKRSAAMNVCKLLIEIGEIEKDLKPKTNQVEEVLKTEEKNLFPNWIDESPTKQPGTKSPTKQPGTKSRIQTYTVSYPDCMNECRPRPHVTLYLHVINVSPKFAVPTDNRQKIFYDLFTSSSTFGLLTSKPWLNIYQFPLFTSMGEYCCQLNVNVRQMKLDQLHIRLLEMFHFNLFYNILSIVKDFSCLVFDTDNKHNSYLVVPVMDDNIDWQMVENNKCNNNTSVAVCDNVIPELSVVLPYYRHDSKVHPYIVTKVCRNMSPLYPFPNDKYSSYKHYFESQYSDVCIKNLQQPLLEVKPVPIRINYLQPRKSKAGGIKSKRRQQEQYEDSEEHLVPELCHQLPHPALLYLKSTILPSVLHRIQSAYYVQQLRSGIAGSVNIGCEIVDLWQPLCVDPLYDLNEPEKTKNVSIVRVKAKKMERNNWPGEKMPADLIKNLEDISECDLKYYVEFANKRNNSRRNVDRDMDGLIVDRAVCPLSVLDKKYKLGDVGPELKELLEATTSMSAGDVVNMERLESLGDSFLKFSTSLFLFKNYPLDEGVLTHIKGRMVGNRNLLYCAIARGLPKVINHCTVAPKTEWCPPMFKVVPRMKDEIVHRNLPIDCLYQVRLSEAEQRTGELTDDNEKDIDGILASVDSKAEGTTVITASEMFILQKSMRDKTVADTVEAIIGAYIKSCGVRAGFSILSYLKILPTNNVDLLLDEPIVPKTEEDVTQKVNFVLNTVGYGQLEALLGYKFKNKLYLLQALTHPSYIRNRITQSYQRLEFLGDALLDFLITSYIFEKCGKMTPGEITDLRSSLVNNVTFACLTVKYNLHKYLLFSSSLLMDAIDRFVKLQIDRDHVVDEAVLILLEENDCSCAQAVDIPKALGDVFESLAGAIFLDSGNSLSTVWNVYYPLLKNEIDLFTIKTPIHPVRRLKELLTCVEWRYHSNTIRNLSHASVTIYTNEDTKKVFHGLGANKKLAKRSSAKLAVRYLESL